MIITFISPDRTTALILSLFLNKNESQEMSGSGNNKKVQILRKLEGKFSLSAIGVART